MKGGSFKAIRSIASSQISESYAPNDNSIANNDALKWKLK